MGKTRCDFGPIPRSVIVPGLLFVRTLLSGSDGHCLFILSPMTFSLFFFGATTTMTSAGCGGLLMVPSSDRIRARSPFLIFSRKIRFYQTALTVAPPFVYLEDAHPAALYTDPTCAMCRGTSG